MKRMAVQLEEDHKLEENDRGLSEAESVMDERERQDSAQELTYVTHGSSTRKQRRGRGKRGKRGHQCRNSRQVSGNHRDVSEPHVTEQLLDCEFSDRLGLRLGRHHEVPRPCGMSNVLTWTREKEKERTKSPKGEMA